MDLIIKYIRDKAPPNLSAFLKKKGEDQIVGITIERKPIFKALGTIINILAPSKPYDTYFHLSLILDLGNTKNKYRLEKNANVEMTKVPGPDSISETVNVSIPVGKMISANSFIANGMKLMGKDFNHYSAISTNCQDFCNRMLKANGLLTPKALAFIQQDTAKIAAALPGGTKQVFDKITETGQIVDYLKQKIMPEQFITGGHVIMAPNNNPQLNQLIERPVPDGGIFLGRGATHFREGGAILPGNLTGPSFGDGGPIGRKGGKTYSKAELEYMKKLEDDYRKGGLTVDGKFYRENDVLPSGLQAHELSTHKVRRPGFSLGPGDSATLEKTYSKGGIIGPPHTRMGPLIGSDPRTYTPLNLPRRGMVAFRNGGRIIGIDNRGILSTPIYEGDTPLSDRLGVRQFKSGGHITSMFGPNGQRQFIVQ